jgi:RND family efflux transporter MFP subunit
MKNLFAEGAVSQRDVEGAEAAWRAAAAAEAQASKRLDEAEVRAPIAGVIAVRSVESGDRVGDGDPLFRLVNTSELEFEATIPSEYVSQVRAGAPVVLTVTGFPAGSVQGRVARINAAADAATRQVKVYVAVANHGGRLVGGLFASGTVVTRESPRTLAAPTAAIRPGNPSMWVMLVSHGALVRRDVAIGVRDEARDRIEVLRGLAEGDTVVVGPVEGLEQGQRVQVAGGER